MKTTTQRTLARLDAKALQHLKNAWLDGSYELDRHTNPKTLPKAR